MLPSHVLLMPYTFHAYLPLPLLVVTGHSFPCFPSVVRIGCGGSLLDVSVCMYTCYWSSSGSEAEETQIALEQSVERITAVELIYPLKHCVWSNGATSMVV